MKVFEENVKRAHHQCAIWRNALQEPPQLDSTKFGWSRNENTKSFEPVTLLSSTTPAPDYVLKLVFCSCASDSPCASRRFGCVTANLACMYSILPLPR